LVIKEGGKKAPPKDAIGPPKVKEPGSSSVFAKLRKRRIIETLAAFIGGGWLLLEFVHWILVDHYHFPEKSIDVTFVTILGALICTLIWRWFGGRQKPGKFRPEVILIPLVILVTLGLDTNLLLHLKEPESGNIPASKWKNSIAVLPFVDMSPQKDQEWFCDGMTDEIIGQLSNISGLKVPARTSVFFFKGKDQDIRDIGKKLGVATVLEGSIQKIDSRLRARVQLINIADGFHLWSAVFDREMKDVFAIQDEIALAVADKLKITLLAGEKAKLAKPRTESTEAYELYLRARQGSTAWTNASIENSIAYLKRSIQLDPEYAPSHAALAREYCVMAIWGLDTPRAMFAMAKTEAMRAIELDDSSAGAHLALGTIKWRFDWDFSGAEREMLKAIELNPNSSGAHGSYSDYLAIAGRLEEAIVEALKAYELDPISAESERDLAWLFFLAQRYDESIAHFRAALGMKPNQFLELALLAGAYARRGMDRDAAACSVEARELVAVGREQMLDTYLADPFCRIGRRSEVLKWIEAWEHKSAQGHIESFLMATMIAPTGDRDKAFVWLERAFEERSVNMPFLKVHPCLEILHADPRFLDLVRRVGFPEH
jgi:TolB-like protein